MTETTEKSMTLSDTVSVCRASAGLALQEAVNLGEINPAQSRRFGERMDQLFRALTSGASLQWDQSNGSLKIIWPEVVNPILAAVQERQNERKRALEAGVYIPDAALPDSKSEDEI